MALVLAPQCCCGINCGELTECLAAVLDLSATQGHINVDVEVTLTVQNGTCGTCEDEISNTYLFGHDNGTWFGGVSGLCEYQGGISYDYCNTRIYLYLGYGPGPGPDTPSEDLRRWRVAVFTQLQSVPFVPHQADMIWQLYDDDAQNAIRQLCNGGTIELPLTLDSTDGNCLSDGTPVQVRIP